MGEKTEQASPKKLRDAKKKGQIAKSQDLPAAATFIVSIALTMHFVPDLYRYLGETIRNCFSLVTHPDLLSILASVMQNAIYTIFMASIPITLAVCATGMLITFLSIGPVFATDIFKFDIKKFNIIENLKSKFKLKTFIELLKSLIKIAIAGILVYKVVKTSIPVLIQSIAVHPNDAIAIFGYFLWDVVVRVGLFFVFVAIFDFMYQKISFNKEMMMEKFEVKQEYKESEGNPEIKGRRREVAREIAYSDGPAAGAGRANAVVTNPHSIAIALGFEKGLDPCPFILAMGKGQLAEQIISIAEKNNVPMIRNIPLAHSLWDKAKLYEYIPEETYEPVAEIMRWLEELEHNKQAASLIQ